jgi:hypothetical protein
MAIENRPVDGRDADKVAPSARGPQIADYCSHKPESLFPSPIEHLRLPVKETPQPPLLPRSDWVSPVEFGGDPNQDVDHTQAIQRAIDSGRRVLYLPHGSRGWRIDGKVIVRGNIEVFTALEGTIRGSGTIELGDGRADTVWLERINLLYQHVAIRHNARRALVISGTTFGRGNYQHAGRGDLFMEDVVMGRLVIPRGVNFWARQLNIEHKGDQHPEAPEKLVNDGGNVYILGYKTEMAGGVCLTRNGGTTMVFGGMIYAQGAPKEQPMFVVENARLSVTLGEVSWNFPRQGFHVTLRETRGRETRELPGGFHAGRYWHANNATALPLLVAAPR